MIDLFTPFSGSVTRDERRRGSRCCALDGQLVDTTAGSRHPQVRRLQLPPGSSGMKQDENENRRGHIRRVLENTLDAFQRTFLCSCHQSEPSIQRLDDSTGGNNKCCFSRANAHTDTNGGMHWRVGTLLHFIAGIRQHGHSTSISPRRRAAWCACRRRAL